MQGGDWNGFEGMEWTGRAMKLIFAWAGFGFGLHFGMADVDVQDAAICCAQGIFLESSRQTLDAPVAGAEELLV